MIFNRAFISGYHLAHHRAIATVNVVLVLLNLISIPTHGQGDIPLETWRLHLSYNTINHVAAGNNKIYGATQSGVLALDREDNSILTYNTLNGLSSADISHIAFDQDSKQLIVAYADGTIDVIKDNEVYTFYRLRNSNEITLSKKIHHIAINNRLAYLSADFGVLVFDLSQREIKETWRDLGPAGTAHKIYQSTFLNDSIFLATEKGVMAGNVKDNLLDFSNWKRFDTGYFTNSVQHIATFNNKIYAAINGLGLYRYDNGTWTKEQFLDSADFNALSASTESLLIAEGTNIWKLTKPNALEQIKNDMITTPLAVLEDEQSTLWIGDQHHGLVSNTGGTFTFYLPNGPGTTESFRLKFINEKLYASPGGYTTEGLPKGNAGNIDIFFQGLWKTSSSALGDLTDLDIIDNKRYIASFGGGVEQTDNAGNQVIFDSTNSPLQKAATAEKSVYITAVEAAGENLWVANFGAATPLHILTPNGWQSYSFNPLAARYPTNLVLDFSGNVWMPLDPAYGGGLIVFNQQSNSSFYKTEATGNGALPSRAVHAVATDREGDVWIGTAQGIAYFFSPERDAVKPIFENRFLLRDEKITSIEVDGGNRKWIGTTRGVWLFNATGETLIHNFTSQNSPLLSDIIYDIEINPETGEVFFATAKGIVSYRSDATEGKTDVKPLKIFPNPVTSNFSGKVAITGLPENAMVKITDISGKLVSQMQSQGGTAAWNVRDYNGKRAATGIYLVFAASETSSRSAIGKIAVVD